MIERLVNPLSHPGGPWGGPLLFSLAHPDDESFSSAGTIALAVRAGVPVTISAATRGERGESAVPGINSPEELAAVREQELRTAMALIGVSDVRFHGYWDSGMEGTPENADPRAFVQVPRAEAVTRVLVQLRGLRPAVVVTFGPEGGYGHPDHIAIHRATVEAIRLAAESGFRPELGPAWRPRALYFTAIPREILREYAQREDGPFHTLSPAAQARMGTPEAEITTRVDIRSLLPLKAKVILVHKTQVPDPGRFHLGDDPPPGHWRLLDVEHFKRVPMPWEEDVVLDDPLSRLNTMQPAVRNDQ